MHSYTIATSRRVSIITSVTMSRPIKIGIIGGTGLEDPAILKDVEYKEVSTPFGKPSDKLMLGKIHGVSCVILSRHGRSHDKSPTLVPYRANMWALAEEGVDMVLVTTACGSLKEEIRPGHIVIIDQFIDRTTKRQTSFYDGTPGGPLGVCHIPMHTPFCPKLRELLSSVATAQGMTFHGSGTAISIEGPRFSSRAESFLFRSWGADVVNMTTVPEVCLAAELGLPYAAIALSTDYDCWHPDFESVSHELVLKTFAANKEKAIGILLESVRRISEGDWTAYADEQKALAAKAVILSE